MNKATLQTYIDQELSTRQIADKVGKSQGSIRHWLNKYGLKTKINLYNKGKSTKPQCRYCGTEDESEFYGRVNRECKKCVNNRLYALSREKKKRAVELLGGKCEECGYSKCLAAFDFHHRDPNEKDPNFNTMLYWKWEKIEKELKKCSLLCSNCHRELHYNDKGD